jgi:plastocyanin
MPARAPFALLAVPALLIGLTACGSSSSDGSGAGGSTGTAAAAAPVQLSGTVTDKGSKTLGSGATTLELEADDFSFTPTFVKATPGQQLTVEIENQGSATHTFTSAELGVDQEVAPGAKESVSITVPTTGAAGFFCRFHRSSGMQGAIYTGVGQTVTG